MDPKFYQKVLMFSILLSNASLTPVIDMQNNDNLNTKESKINHISLKLTPKNAGYERMNSTDSIKSSDQISYFGFWNDHKFHLRCIKYGAIPLCIAIITTSSLGIFISIMINMPIYYYVVFVCDILFSLLFYFKLFDLALSINSTS